MGEKTIQHADPPAAAGSSESYERDEVGDGDDPSQAFGSQQLGEVRCAAWAIECTAV